MSGASVAFRLDWGVFIHFFTLFFLCLCPTLLGLFALLVRQCVLVCSWLCLGSLYLLSVECLCFFAFLYLLIFAGVLPVFLCLLSLFAFVIKVFLSVFFLCSVSGVILS